MKWRGAGRPTSTSWASLVKRSAVAGLEENCMEARDCSGVSSPVMRVAVAYGTDRLAWRGEL